MKTLAVLALLAAAFSISEALVSFIRWGRTQCPEGTGVVYKGYMAMSYYNSGGAGANYLCMIDKPQFVRGNAGRQDHSGILHGVELEIGPPHQGLFLRDNVGGADLLNQDMPCVRCYVNEDSDVIMVPGSQECGNPGYTLRYKGFLVSEASAARGRSEYVCMDEAPEGLPGGAANMDQALAYPVEVQCGSLPCAPYINGMEATCAVCSV